jgi:outer membrane protein TolC
VAEALVEATEVGVAEAQLAAAQATVRRQKGAFDPEIFAEAMHVSIGQPTASFFAGADVLETDQTTAEAGARLKLPVGTELSASLNTVKLQTNSEFTSLSPQYNSIGRLEIFQPLLKGLGPSTRGVLTAAERDLEAAEARYQDAVYAVRAEVEATYWELYANERDLVVQRLIRDRAIAFLKDTELRLAAGLVGPNEVANARVFLAEQEQVVLDREDALDLVSDRLATLMGRRPTSSNWRFRAIGQPPNEFPLAPVETLVQLALERNYDLRAGERRVEALRALEKKASWDALPTLDLYGMLGGYGLAGKGRDVIFQFDPESEPDTLRTNLDTGPGESISQVVNRDFPTWEVGVVFRYPLGNRTGRGEKDRLRAEVREAEQDLIATRRALEEKVRAQYRELSRGRRRLEVASEGVEASTEQVRIGTIEYEHGRTTAFELVRLGADLALAQQRYSAALVRSARAAAELRRLTAGGYPEMANQVSNDTDR